MNAAIISVMQDYLKKEKTDYALMINGSWGSGKTVFIKKTLNSEIEKIDCPKQKNNNGKNHKSPQPNTPAPSPKQTPSQHPL